MVGPIENLNLPEATYIDLSFNAFNGTLPATLGQDIPSIRQLYIDYNNMEGGIPTTYSTVDMPDLVSLHLNDNSLTGAVPEIWIDWRAKDGAIPAINTIDVENNLLTERIEDEVCQLSVFRRGQMVELSADCDVCRCYDLCDRDCGNA